MADKRAPLIKRGGGNNERQIAVALVWLLEHMVLIQDMVTRLEVSITALEARITILEAPTVNPLDPPDA